VIATVDDHLRALAQEESRQLFQNLAICSGRLPCPHCEDCGPHEDNALLGGQLIFQCALCRSWFKMARYDWDWAFSVRGVLPEIASRVGRVYLRPVSLSSR
jgi:hypothetical protein